MINTFSATSDIPSLSSSISGISPNSSLSLSPYTSTSSGIPSSSLSFEKLGFNGNSSLPSLIPSPSVSGLFGSVPLNSSKKSETPSLSLSSGLSFGF